MVNATLVSPIYLIAISLGVAFFLGLFAKKDQRATNILMLIALAAMTFISAAWFMVPLTAGPLPGIQVFTAGVRPPYAINLFMGTYEAFFTTLVNLVGFLSGLYMYSPMKKNGKYGPIIYLLLIMGLNGIIMSRDLFNIFVFIEIVTIATAGILVLNNNIKALSSGFKYLIATGIISGLLLLGIIFIYYFGGSLNLDSLAAANLSAVKGGVFAIFLVLMAFVLELKPFPANGWALDVYESAPEGVSAVISVASASTTYFLLAKILPIFGGQWYSIITAAGVISFLGANLLGLQQKNPRRLLGYSSVGQIGLLMIILGLGDTLRTNLTYIVFGLLISHYFAKAGLFWLAGIIRANNLEGWAAIRRKPALLFMMGTFIFTLLGLPPFPSFFAKWSLIMDLSKLGMHAWVWIILLGTLLESVYLFRWFGLAIKSDDKNDTEFSVPISKAIPVWVFTLGTYVTGFFFSKLTMEGASLNIFYIPLAFVGGLFIVDKFLPAWIKNTIAITGMSLYAWLYLPELSEFRLIFGIVFLVGGIVTLLAGYATSGKRIGFYPTAIIMYVGLGGLIYSTNFLQFFMSWELMTIGSYFLIIRGKKSMPHALSYMLFSQGGAFLLLAGFGLLFAVNNVITLDTLGSGGEYSGIIYALLAVAFLTKTAAMGLHIWLPGAHAEAETDVSPMVSAILLKAGMFGLVILMLAMGEDQTILGVNLPYVLSWLGAITALVGNLLAAFEEDAKRLVAYSSVGNLGYVVFALAFMSHLGWLTAMAFALNHFIFKTILFLAVGGVVTRTKTRNMYQMGGLIKKMPLSFISVMIGIIALSGVPPLTGFAGRWLTYHVVIEKGWYLQGAVAAFAGLVAFLYCFRLIFAIFLGQPKDKFRKIKEAPIMILFPQYLLIGAIMVFSLMPNMVLKPIGDFLVKYFPHNTITWEGTMAKTSLGYWDGGMIMFVVGGIFCSVFALLFLLNRKSQPVKQFNMVYAAEQPYRPETTHFSYNFFSHYRKALGFLAMPLVTNFWNFVTDLFHSTAEFIRKLYTGNGQTYALHLIIFITVFYFFTMGK